MRAIIAKQRVVGDNILYFFFFLLNCIKIKNRKILEHYIHFLKMNFINCKRVTRVFFGLEFYCIIYHKTLAQKSTYFKFEMNEYRKR